ncbi:hypothetical protein COCNU_10G001200 [Cocos nucifera]|uniref:Uncharacterized protein n=1 Tax=Cocos nucifera TaxID=13894 RepID=A0A8K0N803_COCNU|nr:hypothetical protein COCNU_10G001200 [Cocos nucifera]
MLCNLYHFHLSIGYLLPLLVQLLQLHEPELGELAILVPLKPRPAHGVMYRLREGGGVVGIDLVVADEEVPNEGDLANLGVVKPREAVEEGPGLGADGLWGERRPVLGVTAVVKNHGRPVLPRVHRLDGPVHLGGLLGGVLMMDAHDRVPVVDQGDQFLDVGEVEEVAVDEHGPPLESGEVGSEEAGEGELGALGGAAIAPENPGSAEFRLLDGVDLERHRGALQEGAAAHIKGRILPGVVPYKDLEWRGPFASEIRDAGGGRRDL